MSYDYYDWADENSEELHRVLDEAGASAMMHRLVDTHVEGVRHSVLEEIYKWADDSTIDEGVETASRLGGGFFQKVWEGNVFDAFLHADTNNQRIIAEAYEPEQVIAAGNTYGYEYRETLVQERWPTVIV